MADDPQRDSTGDRELVRRYQAGDRAACDELLARHQDRLYRLALGWLYDPTLASDAVQEVFLRALRGLAAFRFRAAPFTWLYRTCRLVCHEFNRTRRHEPLAAEPPAPDASADDALERRDDERRIHAALHRLTRRQRDVVLLRVFEDLSVRDTAAILRCREGTVKALLHRAMQALRREMTS